jgi:hypothetical protein
MLKVDTKEGIKEPYMPVTFAENGDFIIMQMPFAKWKIIDKKTIKISSDRNKDFNGNAKIIKFTNDILTFDINGTKYTYLKIDKNKIKKINSTFPYIGTWKFENDGLTYTVKFSTPDKFVTVTTGDGSESTYKGNWIYNPKEKSIIIISFLRELKGKNLIKDTSNEKFTLINKNKKFILKKESTNKISIEKLNFKLDDFPEDYSENDDKLPWLDFDNMVDYLATVKEIKYKYHSLINETNTFKTKELISKLKVNQKKRTVKFINLKIENGKEEQYSEKYKGGLSERYNYFFPKESPGPYRILGTQKITVPAGRFDCTIIEGFDGNNKIKYWMINDKPGIYAKIIKEGGFFGNSIYRVTELDKIIYNGEHK